MWPTFDCHFKMSWLISGNFTLANKRALLLHWFICSCYCHRIYLLNCVNSKTCNKTALGGCPSAEQRQMQVHSVWLLFMGCWVRTHKVPLCIKLQRTRFTSAAAGHVAQSVSSPKLSGSCHPLRVTRQLQLCAVSSNTLTETSLSFGFISLPHHYCIYYL